MGKALWCQIGGNHLGQWANGPTGDSRCGVFAVKHSGHLARQDQSLQPWVGFPSWQRGGERVACGGVCVEGAFLPPVAVTQPCLPRSRPQTG